MLKEIKPKILDKLGVDVDIWMETVNQYSESFHAFVGSEKELKGICETTGKKWLAGIRSGRRLYC